MTSETERAVVLPQWRVVFDGRRTADYEAEFTSSEGKLVRQNKLLLPLSDDGERVDMILGGIYFREPPWMSSLSSTVRHTTFARGRARPRPCGIPASPLRAPSSPLPADA